MKNIFIAFSGGLDSSTLFYNYILEKDIKYNIYPIFFDYDQRHYYKEYNSAIKIYNYLKKLNINNHIINEINIINIDLDFLQNSSLINKSQIIDSGAEDKLPNSFVPARNILFLTFLSSLAYDKLNNNEEIIISLANHKDDFNGYPDCRKDTIDSLENTLSLALDRKINIIAPFQELTKIDIVNKSTDFIINNSWSCYDGKFYPCGKCKSCLLKEEAILKRNKS